MALADIIERIESDARAEAESIIAAAEERAGTVLAGARDRANTAKDDTLSAAERAAKRDAETIVVNARLRARDSLVAAKRDMIDTALRDAAEVVASLDDDAYAGFLARYITAAARGGETVSFGAKDAGRASKVMARVAESAPGLDLRQGEPAAAFDRGVVLTGSRVRVDLSLHALVEDRRDELESTAASVLFGEGA